MAKPIAKESKPKSLKSGGEVKMGRAPTGKELQKLEDDIVEEIASRIEVHGY